MQFKKTLLLLVLSSHITACSISTNSESPTLSVSVSESVSSEVGSEAGTDTCNNEDSDYTTLKCLVPDEYIIGLSKIELVDCDAGDCSEEDGELTNATNYVTIYESDNDSGLAVNLSEGANLDSDELSEEIDSGSYGGLRFTITYLQQTLADADVADDLMEGDVTYRICTKDAGCPDAEDSEAGDIMIQSSEDDSFGWLDADNSNAFSATRPSNPVQDDEFTYSDSDSPEGSTEVGFTPEVDNDGADEDGVITLEDGGSYTINAEFSIGAAFRFDDSCSEDDIFDPTCEAGEPGRPSSIAFSAEEE